MKIGIITWHACNNYGSVLQAYALKSFLERNQHTVEIINYRNAFGALWKHIAKILIAKAEYAFPSACAKLSKNPYILFRKNNLNMTQFVYSDSALKKLSEKYDCIICGSDQIWAPSAFNPVYFLNFAPDSVKKISYAPSIGLNYIPDELANSYKKLLSRLDRVSVREYTGAELLKSSCNIDARVVLDPTFLLSKNEWDGISETPKTKENYIFCYFLNKDHQYAAVVKEYAASVGLKTVGITFKANDDCIDTDLRGLTPEQFVGYIKNASYILTDSFHGCAFSLIFGKNFSVFKRFSDDDNRNQNSRIFSLLGKLDLDDRIVHGKSIRDSAIDYNHVNAILAKEKDHSVCFLTNALQ